MLYLDWILLWLTDTGLIDKPEFYGQALLLAHQRKCPALKLISENKSQSVDTMAQVCSAGIDVFTSPVAMQQKE